MTSLVNILTWIILGLGRIILIKLILTWKILGLGTIILIKLIILISTWIIVG